ncbi:MAG: hypothetical protein HZB42_14160 [Sphingobacteriales bacterium]|nr:hypothetical protein [Sphingobacteriales bacterium]
MKPISKSLSLLILVCLLMAASCKKNDFPPPDPFATLDNRLVFKINGYEWQSTESGGGFYKEYNGHEFIYIGFGSGWESINFFINPPYDKSYYIFNKNTSTYGCNLYPQDYISFSRWYPGFTPSETYVTNSVDTGRVDIVLLDTCANRIKGKFFFTGTDINTGKKITVTEGYFDYRR